MLYAFPINKCLPQQHASLAATAAATVRELCSHYMHVFMVPNDDDCCSKSHKFFLQRSGATKKGERKIEEKVRELFRSSC